MGKNKLQRYADNKGFENVFEHTDFKDEEPPKGNWAEEVFENKNPIVLELACGKGEYTTNLAKANPEKNFIGIDIKGDRIWKGAIRAQEEGLQNVRFLRCYIDHLEQFFADNEISEIWITFPDPYLKKGDIKKRLTSPKFLDIYRTVTTSDAQLHLKTDSQQLFRYTLDVISDQGLVVSERIDDLYSETELSDELQIKTYYERKHLERGRTIQYVRFYLNP
ncbi:tRNA (guanosine(46)-N7)-methyltransferase TrmB [Rhodohalobacter sp. 8-1]|uniref:tRNA (guanosine(46)-N7)-methyltransferase TrmB n=1 Tax=Rhodohalobacter sp. 8-1 TaxID=3131972 RepID=UPI0030EDE7EA